MPTVMDIKYATVKGMFTRETDDGIISDINKFEMTYIVIGDSTTDTPITIKNTVGLPILGSTSLYGATCIDIQAEEIELVRHPGTGVRVGLWEVPCKFDSSAKPTTDTTPEVGWEGELENIHFERDMITGRRVETTANEPIFTERPDGCPILTIKRQETYPFDPLRQFLYANHVNKTTFYGAPPGSAYMFPITATEDRITNPDGSSKKVIRAEYRIKFKLRVDYAGNFEQQTWQSQLINQGVQYRETKTSKPIMSTDKTGNVIKVNLDRDGLILRNSTVSMISILTYTGGASGPYCYCAPTGLTVESDHIGSYLVITAGAGSTITTGSYDIIGIATLAGAPGVYYWILDRFPTAAGTSSIATDVIMLIRSPLYRYFNKFYPAEFNALSLGPF